EGFDGSCVDGVSCALRETSLMVPDTGTGAPPIGETPWWGAGTACGDGSVGAGAGIGAGYVSRAIPAMVTMPLLSLIRRRNSLSSGNAFWYSPFQNGSV